MAMRPIASPEPALQGMSLIFCENTVCTFVIFRNFAAWIKLRMCPEPAAMSTPIPEPRKRPQMVCLFPRIAAFGSPLLTSGVAHRQVVAAVGNAGERANPPRAQGDS